MPCSIVQARIKSYKCVVTARCVVSTCLTANECIRTPSRIVSACIVPYERVGMAVGVVVSHHGTNEHVEIGCIVASGVRADNRHESL